MYVPKAGALKATQNRAQGVRKQAHHHHHNRLKSNLSNIQTKNPGVFGIFCLEKFF